MNIHSGQVLIDCRLCHDDTDIPYAGLMQNWFMHVNGTLMQ